MTETALLTDHERIEKLERAVFDLSQFAALQEGATKVLEYLLTSIVLRCANEDVDPRQWLTDYVSASAAGCRLLKAVTKDATTNLYIDAGIDLAAKGFFKRLLERSADFDGAPKGPLANT
jgi:hypothetical protein